MTVPADERTDTDAVVRMALEAARAASLQADELDRAIADVRQWNDERRRR